MEWPELLAQPSAITQAQLRDAFRAALLESPLISKVTDVESDPLMLDAFKASDGRPIRLDIARLNLDIADCDPAARMHRFQARLDSALEVAAWADGEPVGALRDQLIPTIKSASWVATVSAMAGEPLAAVGFLDEIVVVYARDTTSNHAYLSTADLEREGVAISEAQPLALANLRARVPRELDTRGDGRSFLFTAGGNLEASLILLPEIWDNLSTQLPGDIVACVLARDVLLVTATGIPGGLASLVTARDHIFQSMEPSDLISTTLLVRQRGKWSVLDRANG